MQEVYTVDQIATMLNLHPRTIRRYIKDGQLKASRVGGEWRVRRSDVETFMGGRVEEVRKSTINELSAYLNSGQSDIGGKLQVCAIVDYYPDSPEQSMRVAELFMQYMNQSDPDRGKTKFQHYTDTDENKSRYVLWGNPVFVGKVISSLGGVNNDK